jgi:hypothetical protein
MLASVLNSARAVDASVFVVRAFVRMREYMSSHGELARKLKELERKVVGHDSDIEALVAAIRELRAPPKKSKRQIGLKKSQSQKRVPRAPAAADASDMRQSESAATRAHYSMPYFFLEKWAVNPLLGFRARGPRTGDFMANARISDEMMNELRKMRPEEIYQTLSFMVSQLPDPGPNDYAEIFDEAVAAELLTHEQIEKFEKEL